MTLYSHQHESASDKNNSKSKLSQLKLKLHISFPAFIGYPLLSRAKTEEAREFYLLPDSRNNRSMFSCCEIVPEPCKEVPRFL